MAEMEMDMDIPLPEELEWLESTTLYQDEEEVIREEEYEEEDLLPEPSTGTIPTEDPLPEGPSEHWPGHQTYRKRPWPEEVLGSEAPKEAFSEEKRRKSSAASYVEEDEEWLRYSPSKHTAPGPSVVVPTAVDDDPIVDAAAPDESAVPEENFLSRFASEIEGDCIPVTGPRGDRVYAKVSVEAPGAGPKKLRTARSGLLTEPINVLIERVEREALTKALQESTSPADPLCATNSVCEQLWVEKYAPKSFTELLSDEQTNREVLLWLKHWDSCVFGSPIQATSDDVLSSLRRHSTITQHQKPFDNKNAFGKKLTRLDGQMSNQSKNMDDENDTLIGSGDLWSKKSKANNTPEQKVLLLCGPPGLGKTTLAHVAARHCGYRVVEINASDDRTSSTIESKILDVVQMNSVMADSRPKCLVIDEIDGALGEGKGAVDVILKMVVSEKKPAAGQKDSSPDAAPGKNASKRRHKTLTLSRPVICICNDLYAPALRALRQIAKVHIFVQPAVSRVVNRVKYICKKEAFKTSSVALTALAEYTECDIRSCLNTLQFLNNKKKTLNILEVASQVVGRKDLSRSAFDVWREVFQKKKGKHERKPRNGCSVHGDFEFLDALVSNRGDYELTVDGIYENFLKLGYHDPMMHKTGRSLDVLGISDSLLRYTMRTQKMSLHAYQPSIVISINRLIAQVEKPNIEWPKSLQRCWTLHMEKKDIFKSWHNKISPNISRHISNKTFVEDIISPLLHILSPGNLRPVALHLFSEREKEDLNQLVDSMVSYSITYKNLKPESPLVPQKYGSPPDASMLSFDPRIDEFVKFKDYQSGHFVLSSTMKQIVLHEVEKHRIMIGSTGKLADISVGSSSPNFDQTVTSKSCSPAVDISIESNKGMSKASSAASIKNPTSASTKIKNYSVSKAPSTRPTSFFDRFRKPNKELGNLGSAVQEQPATETYLRPLLFKYNEGFTNAVKRPVRVRELL